MANIIKPKRTNTAGNTPTTANLASGELGVNMADKKTYINNGTAVVQIGAGNLSGLGDVNITNPTNTQALVYDTASGKWINGSGGGGGSGDVTGPSSATDNAVARFDTTTGKLIQNSVVTIDDTGNVAGILSEQYNTATTPPTIVQGLEAWDSGNGTLELGLTGGNVSYKYGQQEFARVYNGSGSAMTKGQVVYIVGSQGNRVDVRLAMANAESTSQGTIGFVAESIANGAEGYVQVSGTLPKINTSGLPAGSPVYLSPTIAGAYTIDRPTAPDNTVILGWIERVSATVGSIYIKVDNGYELNELHNVLIQNPFNSETLVYNSSLGVWQNNTVSLTQGVNGILPVCSGGSGTSSPSLVAGTNITICGSWPNQTINASGGGGGGSPATPTVAGIVYGRTNNPCGCSTVAIGYNAGGCAQGGRSIAIGLYSGSTNQSYCAIAIGFNSGKCNQGSWGTAIGFCAGTNFQGSAAISVGPYAGNTYQGQKAIAIGCSAGLQYQNCWAIAIGGSAGNMSQSSNAIAIGRGAGFMNQGINSIAIGQNAGAYSQHNGSIAIGCGISTTGCNQTHIGPIRNVCAIGGLSSLFYNNCTKEIVQGVGGAAPATPTASGAVYGRTTQFCFGTCTGGQTSLGYQAGCNQSSRATAIGWEAGATNQQSYATSLGTYAGRYFQGAATVAIGFGAGQNSQNNYAIAIGTNAGSGCQAPNAIAIGYCAANYNQGPNAIAIGSNAGGSYQPACSIAIGYGTSATGMGQTHIGPIRVTCCTTGFNSVKYNPCTRELIHTTSGGGGGTPATPNTAGVVFGKTNSTGCGGQTALGNNAGNLCQGYSSVAIGAGSGELFQGYCSVAIGQSSGNFFQGVSSVAVGMGAGQSYQSSNAVAVGWHAGYQQQSSWAVAVGYSAGNVGQQGNAVAVGSNAGASCQGSNAIAIGTSAGNISQSANAIAIGAYAGGSFQPSNSIVIAACGMGLNATGPCQTHIGPIRNSTACALPLWYNPSTKEITYG